MYVPELLHQLLHSIEEKLGLHKGCIYLAIDIDWPIWENLKQLALNLLMNTGKVCDGGCMLWYSGYICSVVMSMWIHVLVCAFTCAYIYTYVLCSVT